MNVFDSAEKSIRHCLNEQSFSIARLGKDEIALDMHIHDCYELYYSISGASQFLIDGTQYPINPGNVFLINQYETHMISEADPSTHTRIILNLYPGFVQSLSSPETDLDQCFSHHAPGFQHRLVLDSQQQERIMSCIGQISSAEGYGADLLAKAAILELLVMLNQISKSNQKTELIPAQRSSKQIKDILTYIGQNIQQPMTIDQIAEHFYISPATLCQSFKRSTGTTVNKYITARRITIAKNLLNEGMRVSDVCERAGFSDYSNFYKVFLRLVGVAPKQYAILCARRIGQ